MEYKLENDMLLEVKHIKKYFPVKKSWFSTGKYLLKAVDDVSFSLRKGAAMTGFYACIRFQPSCLRKRCAAIPKP